MTRTSNDLATRLVSHVDSLKSGDVAQTKIIGEQIEKARTFMASHGWVRHVGDIFVGKGLPGKFMSFLVEIAPSVEGVPTAHWVVCGDIPPAYLCADENANAWWALARYVLTMDDWVEAVRAG